MLVPSLPIAWHANKTTRWCHAIGLISLFCYLSTWVLAFDFSRSFEPLLMLTYVVALASQPRRGSAFLDPLWVLLGLWLLVQLVTLPPALTLFPDYAGGQIDDMRGLTKVFLILPIAWILAGRTSLTLAALAVLIVGMVVGSLVRGEPPHELMQLMAAGERPTLGFKNWQHAGVCAGVIMIAQACFARRFFRATANPHAWRQGLARFAFLLIAIWAVAAWTFSMTRAAWLGILVVVGVALLGALLAWRRGLTDQGNLNRYLIVAILCGILITLAVAMAFGDRIVQRLSAEHEVIGAVLRGDLSAVPSSSIGFRIHAWHYAFQLFQEKPWFGWGPKSHIPLLLESTNPVEDTTLGTVVERSGLRHFHSSYVTLLIANGAVGALLYVTTIAAVGTAAWTSWKRRLMPTDIAIFLALFFLFWAVVNAFESYVSYSTGIYLVGAIGAIAYTYRMRERLDRLESSSAASRSPSLP
ncbi:O-antigen ligase family protein [Salinicola halophyticus]|uniref:O-antigen ligase family protein n=1 Tax=Salinicola halophyticus TaxID=1808881 RepID=UPI003F461354